MVQGIVQSLLQNSPVTGVAVGLIDQENISSAYVGELEGEAVTADTIWPVASLTKPVFAFGVLQLVERGLLALDQPLAASEGLRQHLFDPENHSASITARHALSHTTGLPNWRDESGLRFHAAPGSHYHYSGEGLNYLQSVVEHHISQPVTDYLREQVFSPLGMNQTELGTETADSLRPNLYFLLDTLPANSAISLRTTTVDYLRFMQAMFEVESSPVVAEMLKPQTAVGVRPHLHWGLGWGLQTPADGHSIWHWGARSLPQTMSFAVGWPSERKVAVIFTNHAEGLYLCRDVLQALFPEKSFPAFDWLLPAKQWRADGSIPV